jgi:membrane-associated phospholipid phosphatase
MPRKPWTHAVERLRQPPARPLLAPAAGPLAAGLVAVCVAVTVFLGALFTHQGRAGGLDRAVDTPIRASLDQHPGLLELVARIGDPATVTVMTAALIVACLATRRWHGAVLAAVAVPLASAVTELLLKPLVDRTMLGALSYPSGHSTGMFALAGVSAVLLTGPSRPGLPAAARVLLALAGYLAAVAVAVALIGLSAHYFTDTVAGAAVGTAAVLVTAFTLDHLGRPAPEPQSAAGQPVPAPAGRKLTPADVSAAAGGRRPRCPADPAGWPARTGRVTGSRIRCSR